MIQAVPHSKSDWAGRHGAAGLHHRREIRPDSGTHKGTLSMGTPAPATTTRAASYGPCNGSQFFITTGPLAPRRQTHRVRQGERQDVVDAIKQGDDIESIEVA